MHRTFRPPKCSDPFPAPLATPIDVEYVADLALVRFKERLQTGYGADVDYIVERDYTLEVTLDGQVDPFCITVPAGMLTDLASVPWFARWAVSRVGRHLEAAIVHDFLYVARKWDDDPAERAAKRKFADQVMRAAMDKAGVNGIACFLIYVAVRAFGGFRTKPTTCKEFLDIRDPEVAARLHPLDDLVG